MTAAEAGSDREQGRRIVEAIRAFEKKSGEAAVQHERMSVPKPSPDCVVIAVCGEDGAEAYTIAPKAYLAARWTIPWVLKGLEYTQAEVRARREAG